MLGVGLQMLRWHDQARCLGMSETNAQPPGESGDPTPRMASHVMHTQGQHSTTPDLTTSMMATLFEDPLATATQQENDATPRRQPPHPSTYALW